MTYILLPLIFSFLAFFFYLQNTKLFENRICVSFIFLSLRIVRTWSILNIELRLEAERITLCVAKVHSTIKKTFLLFSFFFRQQTHVFQIVKYYFKDIFKTPTCNNTFSYATACPFPFSCRSFFLLLQRHLHIPWGIVALREQDILSSKFYSFIHWLGFHEHREFLSWVLRDHYTL